MPPTQLPKTPYVLTPQALRDRRHALGYTQQELADFLGVGVQTLAHWEAGHQSIGHPKLVAIAIGLERYAWPKSKTGALQPLDRFDLTTGNPRR